MFEKNNGWIISNAEPRHKKLKQQFPKLLFSNNKNRSLFYTNPSAENEWGFNLKTCNLFQRSWCWLHKNYTCFSYTFLHQIYLKKLFLKFLEQCFMPTFEILTVYSIVYWPIRVSSKKIWSPGVPKNFYVIKSVHIWFYNFLQAKKNVMNFYL